MNAASTTRGEPAATATSSSAITRLHIPMIAAVSPPLRTWWYCVLITVSRFVSIWAGDCGSTKLTRPRSRSGLKVTISMPRRRASCSWCSIRGLLVPTFWPKKKMASVCSKSSRRTVPIGTPMVFARATDVLSWHMFELSGRLLQPYIRASS